MLVWGGGGVTQGEAVLGDKTRQKSFVAFLLEKLLLKELVLL